MNKIAVFDIDGTVCREAMSFKQRVLFLTVAYPLTAGLANAIVVLIIYTRRHSLNT